MTSEYTTNLHLDKYTDTDRPNLRDQYNAAMDKLDDAVHTVQGNLATAQTTVAQLQTTVAANKTKADADFKSADDRLKGMGVSTAAEAADFAKHFESVDAEATANTDALTALNAETPEKATTLKNTVSKLQTDVATLQNIEMIPVPKTEWTTIGAGTESVRGYVIGDTSSPARVKGQGLFVASFFFKLGPQEAQVKDNANFQLVENANYQIDSMVKGVDTTNPVAFVSNVDQKTNRFALIVGGSLNKLEIRLWNISGQDVTIPGGSIINATIAVPVKPATK